MKISETFNKNILIKKINNSLFEVKEFYNNGNLFRHYLMNSEEPHGYMKAYDINGELYKYVIFDNGNPIEKIKFEFDAELWMTEYFNNVLVKKLIEEGKYI